MSLPTDIVDMSSCDMLDWSGLAFIDLVLSA